VDEVVIAPDAPAAPQATEAATSPAAAPEVTPAGVAPTGMSRKAVYAEVLLLLGVSLGTAAVYAVLSIITSLTAPAPLRSQTTVINASAGTSHSLLNLAYELVGIAAALVPVALVFYLLYRSGESSRDIGLDRLGMSREALWGAGLAAGVGGVGLGFYLAAFHAGISVNVVPTNLPPVWWRIPALVLVAVQNGILEEVVVCGYLLHRLRQLNWGDNRALVGASLLRGSYHLYQGFGGFLGNAAMGLLFGRMWQRRGRLLRFVIAHSLIDTVAFVGYVVLHGHVSWLP
jgi:membrane protease YdiL (CAAX protease family)